MAHTAWVTMTRGTAGGRRRSPREPRVDAGVEELNEMTIGRTHDPENPLSVPAFEAAKVFGTGSRTPSGPADVVPRQQAGHMIAIDPLVRILFEALASEGPSTHDAKGIQVFQSLNPGPPRISH
jgi:hypothetical protein